MTSNWETKAEEIMADPAASYSLKRALTELVIKDPVDAVNEVDVLFNLMEARCDALFSQALKNGYLTWFDLWTIYPDGVIVRGGEPV